MITSDIPTGKESGEKAICFIIIVHLLSSFIIGYHHRKRGFITWQVYDEVSAGIAEFPKLKLIDKLIEDKTFKLVALSLSQRQDCRKFIGHLGKGEASCIAFAKEQNA